MPPQGKSGGGHAARSAARAARRAEAAAGAAPPPEIGPPAGARARNAKKTAVRGPLQVEMWPLSRLVQYERNPRINDPHVERMAKAITDYGFRIPIVATADGTIVDGHLRFKAARKLKLPEVPVALAENLTEDEIQGFRLLVNKSSEWATWDRDLLPDLLGDLTKNGFDLAKTGFDLPELGLLLAEDDEAEPAPKPRVEKKVVCPACKHAFKL